MPVSLLASITETRLTSGVERPAEPVDIDAPVGTHADDDPSGVHHRVEHCVVLDGRTHGNTAAGFEGAEDRKVVGLGTAGGEDHLARGRSERLGDDVPGLVEHPVGRTGQAMRTRRIAVPVDQLASHDLDRGRARRGAGGVIEVVDHRSRLTTPRAGSGVSALVGKGGRQQVPLVIDLAGVAPTPTRPRFAQPA